MAECVLGEVTAGRDEDAAERFVRHSIASGSTEPADWFAALPGAKDWPRTFDLLEGELLLGSVIRPIVHMLAVECWTHIGWERLPFDLRMRFAKLLLPPYDGMVQHNPYQKPIYDGTPRMLWRPQCTDSWNRCLWTSDERRAHHCARPDGLTEPGQEFAVDRVKAPVGAIIAYLGPWISYPLGEFVVDPELLPPHDAVRARSPERSPWVDMNYVRLTGAYHKEVKRLRAAELKSVKPKRGRKAPVRP